MTSARLALPLAAGLLLTGCVAQGDGSTGTTVTVGSTADACTLSAVEAPAGRVTFEVTNSGTSVTEFYVLGADGTSIVAEVENIGPGLSRELVTSLDAGDYVTACKPGQTGDGIRGDFTVTAGAEAAATTSPELAAAEAEYLEYVREETAALVTGTGEFAAAYSAGRDDEARAAYPVVRAHWERIEPVAESFGTLDPLLDAREADLADGETWSGWHYIEKDLWPPAGSDYTPLTPAQRADAAEQLVSLTAELSDKVTAPDFTVAAFQVSNGAAELLAEVATGKITGEEEIWSGTDLWDMQANVEGAEAAWEALRSHATANDAGLAELIDARFATLTALLAQHGSIDSGFTLYGELSAEEVTALAAAVDGLSEPLSRLTHVVTGA